MGDSSDAEAGICFGGDHVLKLVLVGDGGVGKSCLVSRFAEDTFSDNRLSTIGVEFTERSIQLDGQLIKLQMWDTAGQLERYRAITKAYYKGAYGVVIVYDVTKETSFQHVGLWLDQAKSYGDLNICKLLVGNKCDLTSKRQVDYATAKEYAENLGIPLVETSAKNSANVEQAFVKLVLDVRKRMFDQYKGIEENVPNLKLKPNSLGDHKS